VGRYWEAKLIGGFGLKVGQNKQMGKNNGLPRILFTGGKFPPGGFIGLVIP